MKILERRHKDTLGVMISHLHKNPIKCLECYDKHIDCRDYIFCSYGKLKYVGRKKDYEIPKWCPKRNIS